MTSGYLPPDIVAAARACQARWDIPASVCLAQWALESAWGGAMPPGSNNPFGIKALGTQPCVTSRTHEVMGGSTVTITAHFRKFASLAEAFDAHGRLLATSSHYAKARTVRHDADAFADALTGVYATDPRYGEKLIGLMRGSNLYGYDAPGAAAPPLPPAPPSPAAPKGWFARLRAALSLKTAA